MASEDPLISSDVGAAVEASAAEPGCGRAGELPAAAGSTRATLYPTVRFAEFPEPTRTLAITFSSGPLQGRRFDFEPPRKIVLGRGQDCDIEVFDKLVSRRHCEIDLTGPGATLRDLDSANGTFLNGLPVTTARLEVGGRLLLGDTTLEVQFVTPTDTQRATPGAAETQRRRAVTEPTPHEPKVAIPGYEILGSLGKGAFGTVWKARPLKGDASLESEAGNGQVVAIKVLRAQADLGPEDRIRFLREAELAAALDHPNVVRVVGRGELDSTLYIVMEFVRGETLGRLIDRRGRLPVGEALRILRQIASALEAARIHGIVHRDVKPDNILMSEDGTAKLGDFGFAKQVAGGLPAQKLTQLGEVVGTIAYMSPEQLECSLAADHRSDIYSLGATLFHMLAGRPPFAAARTNVELFMKVLRQPPPALDEFRDDVPRIVNGLVLRCLNKNPAARYQTAGEIVRMTELLGCEDGRSTAR